MASVREALRTGQSSGAVINLNSHLPLGKALAAAWPVAGITASSMTRIHCRSSP
jgi:hypothetical protein